MEEDKVMQIVKFVIVILISILETRVKIVLKPTYVMVVVLLIQMLHFVLSVFVMILLYGVETDVTFVFLTVMHQMEKQMMHVIHVNATELGVLRIAHSVTLQ